MSTASAGRTMMPRWRQFADAWPCCGSRPSRSARREHPLHSCRVDDGSEHGTAGQLQVADTKLALDPTGGADHHHAVGRDRFDLPVFAGLSNGHFDTATGANPVATVERLP